MYLPLLGALYGMTVASTLDYLIPILGALTSAVLAYRFSLFGFLSGILAFWAFALIRYEVVMYLDPSYEPGVLGAVMLGFMAWVLGVVWCSIFSLANIIVSRIKRTA
jgi:hypothetical protein